MHRSTKLFLALVIGLFLWANLTVSPALQTWGPIPPADYGRVHEYLYIRGWPLSPWMFAIVHGLKEHLDVSVLWGVLAFDALIAFVALSSVAYIAERGIRRFDNLGVKRAFQFTLGRLFLLIVLFALPLTLAYYYLHGPKWLHGTIGFFAVDLLRSSLFVFTLSSVYLAIICHITARVSRRQ